MIRVCQLIDLLAKCPPDAMAYAYEGEDIGIGIICPDRSVVFVQTGGDEEEDSHVSGVENMESPR